MNYNELTDFEINKLVAVKQGLNLTEGQYYAPTIGFLEKGKGFNRVDYCNNPSDAWPIILENRIRISPNPTTEIWTAENDIILGSFENGGLNFVEHKNPLRAAMIVYLMMGDE